MFAFYMAVAKQRDLYKGTDENEKLTDYQIEKLSQVGFGKFSQC